MTPLLHLIVTPDITVGAAGEKFSATIRASELVTRELAVIDSHDSVSRALALVDVFEEPRPKLGGSRGSLAEQIHLHVILQ